MLYKENRAHYYTFFIEDDSLQGYTIKDESVNLLRWKVSENLFRYLESKFFNNTNDQPNYFYDFKHPNVNIVLITDDTNKLEEISFFIKSIMQDNKLMEIYSECIFKDKFSKKYEIDYQSFSLKLDKIYNYCVLNNELSNSNNNSNKKAKI